MQFLYRLGRGVRYWIILYLELAKWRVVSLMLITSWVGMELGAVKPMSWKNNLFTLLGIALIASAAASLNHLLDRQRDALMRRTQSRPLPQNKISTQHVRSLAIITIFLGSLLLYFFSNFLTLLLSLLSLFGYSIFREYSRNCVNAKLN